MKIVLLENVKKLGKKDEIVGLSVKVFRKSKPRTFIYISYQHPRLKDHDHEGHIYGGPYVGLIKVLPLIGCVFIEAEQRYQVFR